jgi:hypothetical protein
VAVLFREMVFLRLCRQGAKLGVPLRYYSVGSSAQAEGPPVTATNSRKVILRSETGVTDDILRRGRNFSETFLENSWYRTEK